MKNPFASTAIVLFSVLGVFALYQVIISIAAVVGGAFLGCAITVALIKKPQVETQGHEKDLIDLQEQVDNDISR